MIVKVVLSFIKVQIMKWLSRFKDRDGFRCEQEKKHSLFLRPGDPNFGMLALDVLLHEKRQWHCARQGQGQPPAARHESLHRRHLGIIKHRLVFHHSLFNFKTLLKRFSFFLSPVPIIPSPFQLFFRFLFCSTVVVVVVVAYVLAEEDVGSVILLGIWQINAGE